MTHSGPVLCLPPPSLSAPSLPARMQARVWIKARYLFRRQNAKAYCWAWVLAGDGSVYVLRLPATVHGDDARLVSIVARLRRRQEIRIPEGHPLGPALLLPDAPAVPLTRWSVSWGHPVQRGIRAFAALLDPAVLDQLGALEEPGPFFATAANYNRIATLPPALRLHRLQALARFPPLVAPLLLDRLDGPNLLGERETGERTPARLPPGGTSPVLHAMDHGRDLTGALARHYRIDKALVRGALMRQPWATGAPDMQMLAVLALLPAHARPRHPRPVESVRRALGRLPAIAESGHDRARLASAFHKGWDTVWSQVEDEFPDPVNAMQHSNDFAHQMLQFAGRPPALYNLTQARLQLAWLARLGPLSMLRASRRWHAQPLRDRGVADGLPDTLPALLGNLGLPGGSVRELNSRADLIAEGAAMHHCVDTYWPRCVRTGLRIFHLQAADGTRATAAFAFQGLDAERPFRRLELGGSANSRASGGCRQLARQLEASLNAPALAERIAAMDEARRALPPRSPAGGDQDRFVREPDPQTRRELHKVLAWAARQDDWQPSGTELYRGRIAGFSYGAGGSVLDQLRSGTRLQLLREPENPHDANAVRVLWQGQGIGYVPRLDNADIARRLDLGQVLDARIIANDGQVSRYSPIELAITTTPRRRPLPG